MSERGELEAFYRRYNALCNEHRFDRLGEFVAEDVRVNGDVQGLTGYVAGLREVVRGFPDYWWELRHLLIDGDWIAAHFVDTGTRRGTAFGVPATIRQGVEPHPWSASQNAARTASAPMPSPLDPASVVSQPSVRPPSWIIAEQQNTTVAGIPSRRSTRAAGRPRRSTTAGYCPCSVPAGRRQ